MAYYPVYLCSIMCLRKTDSTSNKQSHILFTRMKSLHRNQMIRVLKKVQVNTRSIWRLYQCQKPRSRGKNLRMVIINSNHIFSKVKDDSCFYLRVKLWLRFYNPYRSIIECSDSHGWQVWNITTTFASSFGTGNLSISHHIIRLYILYFWMFMHRCNKLQS